MGSASPPSALGEARRVRLRRLRGRGRFVGGGGGGVFGFGGEACRNQLRHFSFGLGPFLFWVLGLGRGVASLAPAGRRAWILFLPSASSGRLARGWLRCLAFQWGRLAASGVRKDACQACLRCLRHFSSRLLGVEKAPGRSCWLHEEMAWRCFFRSGYCPGAGLPSAKEELLSLTGWRYAGPPVPRPEGGRRGSISKTQAGCSCTPGRRRLARCAGW